MWRRAAELALRLGVCRTARALALRLDYNSLKRHIAALPGGQGQSFGEPVPKSFRATQVETTSATFLELLAPVAATIAECTMMVESATGAKLRIEMRGVPATSISTVVREFSQ